MGFKWDHLSISQARADILAVLSPPGTELPLGEIAARLAIVGQAHRAKLRERLEAMWFADLVQYRKVKAKRYWSRKPAPAAAQQPAPAAATPGPVAAGGN